MTTLTVNVEDMRGADVSCDEEALKVRFEDGRVISAVSAASIGDAQGACAC